MDVTLIRHTTPDIDKGVCYGQTDVGLREDLFETEKRAMLQRLPSDIEQVYTSPLVRCQFLAQRLSTDLKTDKRLMELHFGEWENRKWKDINQAELNAWMQDFVHQKAGKGESYADLYRRSLEFIQEIKEEPYEKIAIVTHAGNIRSLVSYALGLPLKNSFRLHLDYGSVVGITLGESAQGNRLNLHIG